MAGTSPDWRRLMEERIKGLEEKSKMFGMAIWASYGVGIFTGIFSKQIIHILFP